MLYKVVDRLAITYDRLRGIDVRQTMDCHSAGTNSNTSHGYAPSGDRYLSDALKALNIAESDSIIDVGCGKGSAMLVMCRFPFRRVDGLELSHKLAQIGRANLRRVGAVCSEIIEGDAQEFRYYSGYNMVYFYNPFVASVIEHVVSRITCFCVAKKVTILYNNPICHQAIVASGVFHKVAEYPNKWGTGIYVYTNEA